MQLLQINNQKTSPFPIKEEVVVGTDFDCDIQLNHPVLQGKHFIIKCLPYGCTLKVLVGKLKVNGTTISKQCMIEPGEIIQIDDLLLRLVDDEYVPLDSQFDANQLNPKTKPNQSAVFGLRSYDQKDQGQFIIDDFHHPDGWHVMRQENALHFIDQQRITHLNGKKIPQAALINGDVIIGADYKYKVELPGTSGYSKFSPSHPRNVLMTEQINPDNLAPTQKATLKSNLWWITLLAGLSLLMLLVLFSSK